jgi:hypothetical protein
MPLSDQYAFQRFALLATAYPLPISAIRHTLEKLSEADQRKLLTLILEQGLQFFWLEALREMPDLPFADAGAAQLKKRCFTCSTRYLAQKQAIIQLDSLFAEENITYAVFKGAHVREVVYRNPAFRPSVDVDILIADADKYRVIRLLCASGYSLNADRENISHEVSLTRDNVTIDLHWHIMRPGRTRMELTDLLLHSRARCGYFWGLGNTATLLVLLVHPVFTKYSTAPQSSIVRLADLKRWITHQPIEWQELLHVLEEAGVKTAAWITATLLADLTGCAIPAFVDNAISPPQPKRFLLERWLSLNLSSKFADYPIFSKYIFTLLAHDKVTDILKFIRILRDEKQRAEEIWGEMQKVCRGE